MLECNLGTGGAIRLSFTSRYHVKTTGYRITCLQ